MAISKLFQQFTKGAGDASTQADQMPSAKEVDVQTLTQNANAGDQVAASNTPNTLSSLNPIEKGIIEEEIIETLRTIYDPEIPVNIYEMGLVYEIDVNSKTRFVDVKMTLTSPGCPVAGTLPPEVERKVAAVEGVSGAKVELVWEPTWNMEMMSEDARLELGFF